MKLKTLATRNYSVSELESCLKPFSREYLLRVAAVFLSNKYNKEFQDYLNLIQLMPSIYNSILLFAKGDKVYIHEEEWAGLLTILSSMEQQPNQKGDVFDFLCAQCIKSNHHYEYVPYVYGRLHFLADWMADEFESLGFERVTGVSIEHFSVLFFGAFALTVNEGAIPGIDPNQFFKFFRFNESESKKYLDLLEEEFSLDIEEAEMELRTRIKGKKTFEDSYCFYEEKPFLKVSNYYLLTSPHTISSNLISMWSRFFIKSYGGKQGKLTGAYGLAFEEYIVSLIQRATKGGEREPLYKDSRDKGVDLVFLKKGKIPVLVEIHKSTIYKSLVFDYSIENLETFVLDKIVPKFEQIFKWLLSHDFIYNGVNVLADLKRTQFIVVLAQDVPVLHLDRPSRLVMELINDSWRNITGLSRELKSKNVHILGPGAIEKLGGICEKLGLNPFMILFDYKKYHSKTRELNFSPPDEVNIRLGFESWLNENYDLSDAKNQFVMQLSDNLYRKAIDEVKQRINDKDEPSTLSKEDPE